MTHSVPAAVGHPVAAQPRQATEADIRGIAQALAAAFFEDPVFSWLYPDRARRRELGVPFFALLTRAYLPMGETYTTDDHVAGAVWAPPGAQDDEELPAAVEELAGDDARRTFELFEMMDELHPTDPHHYLFLLGTKPDWQGRGIGSALMRPVLDTCDRDGVPAYLEATSEGNRRLYARHGFEVVGEVIPPGGPTLWRMWRTPR